MMPHMGSDHHDDSHQVIQVIRADPRPRDQLSVRVTVAGSSGSGKSALVVRYLTRRFLGEYHHQSTLYYKSIGVGDYRIPLEVLDTDNTVITLVPGEVLLVVFSITDRSSLLGARTVLDKLERTDGDSNRVLLLGNKMDLDHLREVYTSEGSKLASEYKVQFSEISVAEDADALCDLLNGVMLQTWRDTLSRHRDTESRDTGHEKTRRPGMWSLLTNILGGSRPSGPGAQGPERGRSSLPPDLG